MQCSLGQRPSRIKTVVQGVHEVIDDLTKLKIVKLGYKESEFLVRTELRGKAYLAFKSFHYTFNPRHL